MNSVACFPVRGPNSLNFRENQVASLNVYSSSYLKNSLQFQEFIRNGLTSSTIPSIASSPYYKRIRKATERLIDNQQNESNIRAKPLFPKVIYTNNDSVSVLIMYHNHSKCNNSLSSK